MKSYIMWILSTLFAIELSWILVDVSDYYLVLQYVVSLGTLACAGVLVRTPFHGITSKLKQLLFICIIGLGLMNLGNIAFIQNWGDKIAFINFGLAFICLAYYYISTYTSILAEE